MSHAHHAGHRVDQQSGRREKLGLPLMKAEWMEQVGQQETPLKRSS